MRKLKLFFACLLMAVLSIGQVWGAAYVAPYLNGTAGSNVNITGSNYESGSAGQFSWTATNASQTNTQWRLAENGSIAFTANSGYSISKVEITSTDTYPGTWSATAGTVSSKTISGINASSVTISTATAARIQNVKVYAVTASTKPTVSLDPDGGNFIESVEVTMTPSTGATAYYTTDATKKTIPSTTTWTAYNGSTKPTFTETTTIWVAAVKDATWSDVVEKTFTKVTPVTSYDIDFETNDLSLYVNWDFTNIGIRSTIARHGGDYYGANVNSGGNGTATCSITTKSKIAAPGTLTFYISKESSNTTASSWKAEVSSDGSDWTEVETFDAHLMTLGTWNECIADLSAYSDVYVRISYGSSSAIRTIDDISLVMASGIAKPTITGEENFLTSTEVTMSCTTDGAAIYYTTTESAKATPATSGDWTAYNGASKPSFSATTTVWAAAKKNDAWSAVAEKTFTKATILTVAEALTIIEGLDNKTATTAEYYVSGVVSTVTALTVDGTGEYYISADGTKTSELQVYKGKWVGGANFTSTDQLIEGDDVTIKGKLKKYNDYKELDQNNEVVLYKLKARLAWSEESYEADLSSSNTYPSLTNTNGVSVSYSSSNTDAATINPSTGAISLVAVGSTTIKAAFTGNETYKANEVSYTLTVSNSVLRADISFEENGGSDVADLTDQSNLPDPLPTITKAGYNFGGWWTTSDFQDGTEAVAGDAVTSTDPITLYAKWLNPYTVTEALTMIDALADNGETGNVYVFGIVCTAPSNLISGGYLTYYISIDGTETNRLQVYKGKDENNVAFTDKDDVQKDDQVVVYGPLKKFKQGNNIIPEFNTGNYLYSLSRKAEAGIEWGVASFDAYIGESNTFPTLTNPNSLTVTYSSSNTTAATIDENTGEIALGITPNVSTTITASFAGNAGYKEAEVSYTLNVYMPVNPGKITYEENGGSTVTDVTTPVDNFPNPLPEPTRENYIFAGWWTTSTFNDGTQAVAGAPMDGDVILYAKWTEIPVWARTYTSNVAIESNTAAHVTIGEDTYDAAKTSKGASATITLPQGVTTIHLHLVAWKDEAQTVSVTGACFNEAKELEITANDGVSGQGTTYSLGESGVDYYFSLTPDKAVAADEVITITAASGLRFVLFGVNAVYPEITLNPATSFDFGTVASGQTKDQVFEITANDNVVGPIAASIIDDNDGKFSAGGIVDNKVTVTFAPGEATSGTFEAKLQVAATNVTAIVNLSGTASTIPAAVMSFPQASYDANLGSEFTEPTLTTDPEGLAVTYASSVEGVATVDVETGEITLVAEGATVITASFAGNDDYSANSATYTLNVADPNKDVLTAALIGQSSYGSWNNKQFGSTVKYAGNSTTGTSTNAGAIQMRVQNPSGIVTTTAIGYLKSISAAETTNGNNSLEIYAKGSAYESSADLYSSDEAVKGVKIGTIGKEGGALVFVDGKAYSDNYKYIGIKPVGGAVYYDDITITWTPVVFASFDVTYKAGEATGGDIVESIEEGSNISLKAANTFEAPEGKIFAGWLLEGEEDVREASSKYTVTAAATFTAQWVSVYTITYTAGDGTGEDVIVPNVQAGDYELADNTFTAPDNMEFAGWKLNNAGETLAAGANYNVTGNASFTAQWSIVKQAADLAYATTSYIITRGREFEAPELTNPHGLAVTYSGNNNAVATVDPTTGAISLQGVVGEVTVTATSAATDYYYAGEASYTLKVKDASLAGGWVRLTNANTLVAGMKVIVAQYVSSQNGMIKTMGGQNTNNRAEVEGTLQNDTLISDEGTEILTLVAIKNTTNFALKTADNKYLYAASSGSNHLKSQAKIDGNATWTISLSGDGKATITAQGENTRNLMRYNSGNEIFSCYGSGQQDIALYSKTVGISSGETDASTLDEYADVVVADGGKLVINEGTKPLGNITGNVEVNAPLQAEGVHLSVNNTMTINSTVNVPSFSISVQLGGAGQATNVNVSGSGSIAAPEGYVDMALTDNGRGGAGQWHSFTVPFPVDALNGIYNAETGDKLINETNYAIMDYHSDIRANGEYGWKKYRGILQPGTFYLITVDGSCPNLRFMKTQGSNYVAANNIALTYQSGTGASTDYGWCGVGNQNMFGGYVNFTVQILNATGTAYEDVDGNSQKFSACIPFFIQVTQNETLVMSTTNPSAAPARVQTNEIKNQRIYFGNENFTDRLTVSANEDALNQYEIGKDLLKMTVSNTPTVPQIFGSAYGNKLCRVNAPMANDQAEVALDLYAPAAGEYTISASENENATVYLVRNGSIIWNLSSGAYTAEFAKGNNAGYSIRIVKAPQITTGVENSGLLNGANGVQKVVIDNHVYILRNEQMYNVNGQVVK